MYTREGSGYKQRASKQKEFSYYQNKEVQGCIAQVMSWPVINLVTQLFYKCQDRNQMKATYLNVQIWTEKITVPRQLPFYMVRTVTNSTIMFFWTE